MAKAPERMQSRHVREKATIDHLVQDVYKPKPPDERHAPHSPTTSAQAGGYSGGMRNRLTRVEYGVWRSGVEGTSSGVGPDVSARRCANALPKPRRAVSS